MRRRCNVDRVLVLNNHPAMFCLSATRINLIRISCCRSPKGFLGIACAPMGRGSNSPEFRLDVGTFCETHLRCIVGTFCETPSVYWMLQPICSNYFGKHSVISPQFSDMNGLS
jgi:hypothetical protein